MASLFTHALVGGAIAQAGKADWRNTWRFWTVCIVCAILPDIDVIGFSMGIHYGDLWGHRGMTHSLLFAAVTAICVVPICSSHGIGQKCLFVLLLFLVTASHGVLDALTNGGLGVAFFSPFDPQRYFFPWRPVAVSPIGANAFFSPRGLHVIWSEIRWLWGPALLLAVSIWLLRLLRKTRAVANPTTKLG